MSKLILTIMSYMICLVFFVAVIEAAAALLQKVEDIPLLRRKIWNRHRRNYQKLRNAH